jgi:hypothetical protein
MHLGKLVSDLNAKQAAHENRIVVCLQKRGPLRDNEVRLYTGAIRRVGNPIHQAAVDNLVAQGVIRKLTTTRTNSFILELVESVSQKSSGSLTAGKHFGGAAAKSA